MTCAEFERVVTDAARGERLASGSLRQHATTCARCATLLSSQAAVTQALRMLADEDAARMASPQVEAAALAAFRQRRAATAPAAPAAAMAPVIELASARRMFVQPGLRRSSARWPAVAAAVAAVLLVSLMRMRPDSPAAPAASVTPSAADSAATDSSIIARAEAIAKALPKPSLAAPASPVSTSAARRTAQPLRSAQEEQVIAALASRQLTAVSTTASAAVGAIPAIPAMPGEGAAASPGATPKNDTASSFVGPFAKVTFASANASTTGDQGPDVDDGAPFTPLPYAEPLRPTEMRQVIRVSVGQTDGKATGAGPASTGKSEPIFADVLVGEDGIARGIRIVHKN